MPPRQTAALLFTDEANASADEIPPLAFEYEDELRGVLDRLKGDLEKRVEGKKAAGTGSAKGKEKAVPLDDQQRRRMEEMVLKFYTKIEAVILSNCTIGGLSWSEYEKKKKRGEVGKTQPFDENLHQRVLNYQNELFDAREVNARERVDAPTRTAQYIQEVVSIDKAHLAKLEEAQIDVPEEISLPKPRSRKSTGGAVDAPSAVQAQEYFEEGKQALDKLLEDVPKLATAAEETRKVALDAANLE
ncbi:serine/arginine repetitive matrix protein 2 [Rhodotorula toruloides]|uniref:Serine/arginine repetitive matrix protein 2 n=1 Tax=Rhodotorula toruloides TaxID=5286 RepID=A0A511KRY7_RHOTO|nr:serine/arginine repetitive matrix protein 2 [Rhodotorula toruloides]